MRIHEAPSLCTSAGAKRRNSLIFLFRFISPIFCLPFAFDFFHSLFLWTELCNWYKNGNAVVANTTTAAAQQKTENNETEKLDDWLKSRSSILCIQTLHNVNQLKTEWNIDRTTTVSLYRASRSLRYGIGNRLWNNWIGSSSMCDTTFRCDESTLFHCFPSAAISVNNIYFMFRNWLLYSSAQLVRTISPDPNYQLFRALMCSDNDYTKDLLIIDSNISDFTSLSHFPVDFDSDKFPPTFVRAGRYCIGDDKRRGRKGKCAEEIDGNSNIRMQNIIISCYVYREISTTTL